MEKWNHAEIAVFWKLLEKEISINIHSLREFQELLKKEAGLQNQIKYIHHNYKFSSIFSYLYSSFKDVAVINRFMKE